MVIDINSVTNSNLIINAKADMVGYNLQQNPLYGPDTEESNGLQQEERK